MKKLFIITIILLFQSFPSFGNPEGKGLICKNTTVTSEIKKIILYLEEDMTMVFGSKKQMK